MTGTPPTGLLREALAIGEQMAELQRLSPPLWGLAEAARCRGDHDAALVLCERGFQASAEVTDAAYLFPYLLTGVRAHLAHNEADAAQAWVGPGRRGADRPRHPWHPARDRSRPGAHPARAGRGIRGPPAAGGGERGVAGPAPVLGGRLGPARPRGRRRPGRGAAARRPLLASEVRDLAAAAGATTLADAADRLAASSGRARPADPWHPLSAREFEVAQLVAAGLTNRQIAERLVLAPKTVSAHVTHILDKLGAARRAEIAAWCATVRPGASP